MAFTGIAVACGAGALFFGFYGAQVAYHALTFEGEGSLGHVGLYIAAWLFPALALFLGALSFLAWRFARQRPRGDGPRT